MVKNIIERVRHIVDGDKSTYNLWERLRQIPTTFGKGCAKYLQNLTQVIQAL